MPCHNFDFLSLPDLLHRRELFSRVGCGLTGIALASLLGDDDARANDVPTSPRTAALGGAHYAPKARAVIQLFQHGGPSHMDLFDPKPELNKRDGQPMPKYFNDLVAISAHGGLLGTPFRFRPAGECGVEYSEIIPHIASCADDIAVIRSMHAEHNNHEQALWQMHTGLTITGRPAIGAWVNYALGSENHDLPAYVVLRNDGGMPVDGIRNWSAGWLPPRYAGVHLRNTGTPVLFLQPQTALAPDVQRLRGDLLRGLNDEHRATHAIIDPQLEARIASYELAARMQLSATEALDLNQETKETQAAYGLSNPTTAAYGRRCLMARRLVERGVRYVQVFVEGQRWDTHGDNANATKKICDETDQPAAALLKDLKQRGLLDSTLLVWGGEFGRTPVSQGGNGRDHHKQGFSLWLAGAGIKGGQTYGATDELGYHAVENRTKVADLHATIFHLLGLDHQRVSYRLRGRDERLTDVYDAKILTPLLT
ncbi:MAG: DUF1501 domain-containing protein [Planctomycetales bacterium]|nr:DUF1501 domain-containing protein [Planctomycetales bacterium]